MCQQQHVITLGQALTCGVTKGAVDAKVRSGAWVRVAKGVYRLAGFEEGWAQALWIAHLSAGPASVVSHEAAAQLHDLRKVQRDLVTLTVPSGYHPRVPGARFTSSSEPATHRVVVNGLPVTTPARTIVDLAGRPDVSAARMDAIVVAAHRERKVTVSQVAAVVGELGRAGRPGIRKLDKVFEARAPGPPIPASELEEQLHVVLRLAGLDHLAVPQHPLPAGPLVGFADAAFPLAKLIIEADGRRWHSQEEDMERDRERDLQAAIQGWLTVRLMHRHLRRDPGRRAEQIRAVYDDRLGLRRAP
jgi:very-short-patch-repair endonuclease